MNAPKHVSSTNSATSVSDSASFLNNESVSAFATYTLAACYVAAAPGETLNMAPMSAVLTIKGQDRQADTILILYTACTYKIK